MSEPRTTIDYNGKTYPFYKTNRGQVDFENAGFTSKEIKEGKTVALLALAFYTLRDCAKRNETPIKDSFEEFIDNSDPQIVTVFVRLNDSRIELEKNNKAKKYPNESQVSGNPGDARAAVE